MMLGRATQNVCVLVPSCVCLRLRIFRQTGRPIWWMLDGGRGTHRDRLIGAKKGKQWDKRTRGGKGGTKETLKTSASFDRKREAKDERGQREAARERKKDGFWKLKIDNRRYKR